MVNSHKFYPTTNKELRALCSDESVHLGDIDTSFITDMSCIFKDSTRNDFNGIETWDTSKVTDMRDMFAWAFTFNADISGWDVSKVKNMACMFYKAEKFNQDISKWKTHNVVDMESMFQGAKAFNQPIGSWNTSKVNDMTDMFFGAESFNHPIGNWNVSNVFDFSSMFAGAKKFNQDISKWKVHPSARVDYMFSECFVDKKFKPIACRKRTPPQIRQ